LLELRIPRAANVAGITDRLRLWAMHPCEPG